jgi:hypothetical protein
MKQKNYKEKKSKRVEKGSEFPGSEGRKKNTTNEQLSYNGEEIAGHKSIFLG